MPAASADGVPPEAVRFVTADDGAAVNRCGKDPANAAAASAIRVSGVATRPLSEPLGEIGERARYFRVGPSRLGGIGRILKQARDLGGIDQLSVGQTIRQNFQSIFKRNDTRLKLFTFFRHGPT